MFYIVGVCPNGTAFVMDTDDRVIEKAGKIRLRNSLLMGIKITGAELYPKPKGVSISAPKFQGDRISLLESFHEEVDGRDVISLSYWCESGWCAEVGVFHNGKYGLIDTIYGSNKKLRLPIFKHSDKPNVVVGSLYEVERGDISGRGRLTKRYQYANVNGEYVMQSYYE